MQVRSRVVVITCVIPFFFGIDTSDIDAQYEINVDQNASRRYQTAHSTCCLQCLGCRICPSSGTMSVTSSYPTCRPSYFQELCLSIIPSFAHLIDLQAMKYCILPRIKKICFETITLSVSKWLCITRSRWSFVPFKVRVNCLICLGKLVESLDKWVIIDEVLPLLQSIPSREPAVLMGILGIIKVAMSSSKAGGLPREVLATKVLPFLVPISIETSLNLDQVRSAYKPWNERLCPFAIVQRVHSND